MSLVDVELSLKSERLPREVRAFISRANRRIDEFTEARRSSPIPGFVPCDFESAYRTLAAIVESGVAAGSYFCEWGSGFGVVTCLAAMLEFDAHGIEIEPDLVEEATQLAVAGDLPVEFACGTFLPSEAQEMATSPGEFSWLAEGGADAYEELGLGIEDFDVILCVSLARRGRYD